MIKYYTIILCSFFLSSATAQSWCAPGATWRYSVLFIYGYIEFSYASDTLIDGMEAQVISHASVLQYPQPPPQPPSDPQYTYDPVAFITRNDGDFVHLWHHATQTWDTLFWWGAQVGDGWMMAHGGDECEPFEVLDIGTMDVDGVELRWLDLNNVSGRIIERIGSPWEFLPFCPPGHVDGMGGLRCYTDDEIHYQPDWEYGCTTLVSVDEIAVHEIKIFPNPGIDQFTLQLPPGKHQLQLFDALGRSVIETTINSDQAVIDTRPLPSGIYHIHMKDDAGTMTRTTWIKQ